MALFDVLAEHAPPDSLLWRVGNTPLVRLSRVVEGFPPEVEFWVKLEGANPGGSVKDRAALGMVLDGLSSGRFSAGKALLDSTSGNTGIAYAMIGAHLGFPVELCLPANCSEERRRILFAYGATLHLSDPLLGSDGAILLSRELLSRDPERYFKPDQYNNPANPRAHEETTGPEIFRQTRGRVTHFFAGIGTSGTVIGAARALRRLAPGARCFAVQPAEGFHGIEGLKHMPSSIVPSIWKPEELDGVLPADTDAAYDMTKRLARREGLFVGQSTGAAVRAAMDHLRRAEAASAVAVIISPDGGDKYLSTRVWE
ncbi:MAG: pyridoxal-phosphate dependent enzyme [Planctomycetes bacterium]|nr:pyridoxal-phosphate dependent enzyme [Planctomycetota bacterium]